MTLRLWCWCWPSAGTSVNCNNIQVVTVIIMIGPAVTLAFQGSCAATPKPDLSDPRAPGRPAGPGVQVRVPSLPASGVSDAARGLHWQPVTSTCQCQCQCQPLIRTRSSLPVASSDRDSESDCLSRSGWNRGSRPEVPAAELEAPEPAAGLRSLPVPGKVTDKPDVRVAQAVSWLRVPS